MPRAEQMPGNGDTPGASLSEPVVVDSTKDIPEIFVDGYKNVTIFDLVIRLNLTANYPQVDKAEMETRLVGRLVMPLPAFLRIYEGFGNLIRDMEARGMISKTGGPSQ